MHFRSPTAKSALVTQWHRQPTEKSESSCIVIGCHRSPSVPGLTYINSINQQKKERVKESLNTTPLVIFKPGGLNLSRRDLDRHLKKLVSTCWEKPCLDVSRLVLTKSWQSLDSLDHPKILIFVKTPIETLDLNIWKSLSPRVEKISTGFKRWSRQIKKSQSRLVSTVETPRLS
jgi:hypothetical protein